MEAQDKSSIGSPRAKGDIRGIRSGKQKEKNLVSSVIMNCKMP